MSWQREFEDPIPLPNGNKQLITLLDAGMMLALYPRGERVFNPDRRDPHWGKRKLKRDE
jgi:hypothetical protein